MKPTASCIGGGVKVKNVTNSVLHSLKRGTLNGLITNYTDKCNNLNNTKTNQKNMHYIYIFCTINCVWLICNLLIMSSNNLKIKLKHKQNIILKHQNIVYGNIISNQIKT